jgi:hypothetical protein
VRSRTVHRYVPIGEGGGRCRWCDKVLIGKRGKYRDRPDPTRSWCRDPDGTSPCLREWNLHRDSGMQFAWLEANRGLRCAWCRVENPQRWKACGSMSAGGFTAWWPPMPWSGPVKTNEWWRARFEFIERCRRWFPHWGEATAVELATDLEVDHIIPLWLVAIEIPEWDRRRFFGPDNLQLLCSRCHKIKTKREAGERAALKAFLKAQIALPL